MNAGGSRELLQYSVNADGTLSPASPATVPDGSGAERVAVSPDGLHVYVTSSDAQGNAAVFQFSVGPNGTLTPKSPPSVTTGDQAIGVAVAPNGKSVYVAAPVGPVNLPGKVYQYSVGSGACSSRRRPHPSPPA